MRALVLGLALATVALAGCATTQPSAGYHHFLLMNIEAADAAQPSSVMHVDARMLRTTAKTPADVADLQTAAPAPNLLALSLARNETTTVDVYSVKVEVGEAACLCVTSEQGSPVYSLMESRDGASTVGRMHEDAIYIRVTVEDFNEAAGEGHVSLEAVLQTRGRIDAYYAADNREFREGETLSFEPTALDWPKATAQRPATAL